MSEFELSREEMRAMGYRVIDAIVERFATIEQRPAVRVGKGETLRARLEEPLPEDGRPFEEILERVENDVLEFGVTLAHPRFFAFISSPSNYVSAVADALTAGYNPFVGTWLGGSGPIQLELVTLGWLREVCGMPEQSGGLFTSGGSMANLTALATARAVKAGERFGDCVVYYSDQTHYSNERALRLLGFASDQMRVVATDAQYRLDVAALCGAIDEDRAAGKRPLCVVATAGTTNIGAVDPLGDIADVCADKDMWFHVDGAYGASAALSPKLRGLLAGLERADSVSLDPHKWLFQPFEIGCVLVRDREHLRETFQIMPDYLQDVHRLGEVNLADYGIQLTRNFRALKLWMSLQYYGAKRFRSAIERGVSMAEFAQHELERRSNWEVVTPAQLAIVSFRYCPQGWDAARADAINDVLVGEMIKDGFAMLSSTVLDGRVALRLCPINPATTRDDVVRTIDRLEEIISHIGREKS